MARLTTAGRKRISGKNFALPGRRYPIEDASHARNALSRVSQFGTSAEKARVRSKVHSKYPGIGLSTSATVHTAVPHPHRNLGAYLHPRKGR